MIEAIKKAIQMFWELDKEPKLIKISPKAYMRLLREAEYYELSHGETITTFCGIPVEKRKKIPNDTFYIE